MKRCDNDECVLSRECWRYLIAPQDADGIYRYEPQPVMEQGMMNVKCSNFIEMAVYPDNNN